MSELRVKAEADPDGVTINVLMRHPMETGRRKDETGTLVPAHYVETLTCHWQDRLVLTAHCGTGIAKNPFLSFRIRGAATGQSLHFEWVDNLGLRGQAEYPIT